jgi:putative endonuclease
VRPETTIVASGRNGTLYLGVTSDLRARISQHKHGLIEGFSKQYGCKRLVWYEAFDLMTNAIRREKAMKHWSRAWKLNMIEQNNPDWRDLSDDFWDSGV